MTEDYIEEWSRADPFAKSTKADKGVTFVGLGSGVDFKYPPWSIGQDQGQQSFYLGPEDDPVNQPEHYNTGEIECIDYLKDNMSPEAYRGYLEGCSKKYLHRWRYKGKPLQDLEKAQWYLNRLVEELKNG